MKSIILKGRVELEGNKGSSIDEAICAAITFCKSLSCEGTLEFNDVVMDISPQADCSKLIMDYWQQKF